MNRPTPPGPSAPALLQTWRWMLRPPLALLQQHQARYGDAFRLQILGPRYRNEPGHWPLARRTVVVFGGPEQVREIFARSGDSLPAGGAREFLEWFMGPRSIMVLDGERHREERRELSPLFSPERLLELERTMRRAAARAVARWPEGPGIDLHGLVDGALEEINLALAVGARTEQAGPLLRLTRRARRSFAAPIHFVPWLRSDLGPWSPGGRLAAFRRGLRQIVLDRVMSLGAAPAADSCLLDALVAPLAGTAPCEDQLREVVDRIITLLGGMDNTSAAVAWACRHVLANPGALHRMGEEIRSGPESAIPGADSFLEAVLLESMRLTPPIPAVIRRATKPVTIGGFELAPGTFVLASMYLLHRREELFPEPEAFRPERFLGKIPRGGYAPFGAGTRSCLGAGLATLQMRVLFTEMWRRFDIGPDGEPSFREARRNVTVVPAGPLRVMLRQRPAPPPTPGPPSADLTADIPGPGWPALIQTLVSMQKSLRRDKRYLQRYGGIFQLRLLLPRRREEPGRGPVVSGRVVVVSSPDIFRELFTKAQPALAGGEGRQFTEWFLGSKSLLVLDGEEHLNERRELLPLFTPERIARSEEVMGEALAQALKRFPSSGRMRLAPCVDELISGVSARLMFGAVDERTVRRLRDGAFRGLTSITWSVPMLLFPWLRRDLGPWSPGGRAARILAEFQEILAEQVRRIRQEGSDGSWLAHLLALEDPAADSEPVDFRSARVLTILAGTGTVTGAMIWCWYHLLQNPEVLARVREEARALGPVPPHRRPYLEAVCQEAIRIHPPIPILARRAIAPVTLGGYRLEPGTYVVGAILLAHRRPELYPEPERFRPERFLERTFSPYENLPFGGGARRCLGQAIGFRQMTIVLAGLLQAFDFTPLGRFRARIERRAVMMVPRDSLRVAFRRPDAGSTPLRR